MLLVMLLACGSSDTQVGPVHEPTDHPGTDPDADPGSDDGPPPYVADEDPVEPAWTLDEVSAAIGEAVDALRAVRGSDIFYTYAELLDSRSSTCPYTNDDYAELYGVDYWYDSCTVADGTSYSGFGYGYVNTDVVSGQYVYPLSAYLYADLAIGRADGSVFNAAGSASQSIYQDTYYGYEVNSFSAGGEFNWDAPEAAGTWLADGLSLSISELMLHYPGTEYRYVYVDGGVSRLRGMSDTVEFDALYAATAAAGSPCEAEPGGTIRVRDATGEWYEVYFHGPQYGTATSFPPECDGCGEVWFRGERLGEVCPDLAGLYDWEGWTW